MSGKRKKRRKKHGFQRLILIVVVLAIVVLLVFFCIIQPLKQKVTSAITEKLIEMQVSSDSDASAAAEEILESMSEEDREILEEIYKKHFSTQTIADISVYAASGDTSAIISYLQDELNAEELAQIYEIYEKYQDELSDYLE